MAGTNVAERRMPRLEKGERVIWAGQPSQGFRLQPGDLFAIPFSIFWLLMVCGIFLISITAEPEQADPLFLVIMPIFLAIGLYMAVGRLLVDIRIRARTYYTLTNRRAFIDTGLFRPVSRTVNLSAVPEITLRAARKGSGTIMFGNPSPFYSMLPASWPGSSQMLPPSFDIVDNAQDVYDLALAAQRESES